MAASFGGLLDLAGGIVAQPTDERSRDDTAPQVRSCEIVLDVVRSRLRLMRPPFKVRPMRPVSLNRDRIECREEPPRHRKQDVFSGQLLASEFVATSSNTFVRYRPQSLKSDAACGAVDLSKPTYGRKSLGGDRTFRDETIGSE